MKVKERLGKQREIWALGTRVKGEVKKWGERKGNGGDKSERRKGRGEASEDPTPSDFEKELS